MPCHPDIHDNEILYRAIPPTPNFWKDTGKPSSAAFKDSKGTSVDREFHRTESRCCDFLLERKAGYGVVSVVSKQCREFDTYPIGIYAINNPFHAEIHDSAHEVQIKSSKARRIAESVEVLRHP